VLALVEKHRALWSGHLSYIMPTEHRIELKPGSKPVRLNPYLMDLRTRELIKAQVDRMLKLEVIEPSRSEWASPVVLIPEPDGSPLFCIDYRQLNERTVPDSYPLPCMDDCLDSLGDAHLFSTSDCNAGHWKIPTAEKDKPKTALTCRCGTYQCTRLTFGLCNARATFLRAIDMILSGVKWQNVLVYFDDLIIFSTDGARMYQTLKDHYYWPSLAADVFGWVAACPTSANIRLMCTQSTAPMRLFPATEPFAALAIDLLGPSPRTPDRYAYSLVIRDRFNTVTRAVSLKDISALDVLSAFLDT